MNEKKTLCLLLLLTFLFIYTTFAQSSNKDRPVVGIAGFNAETNQGVQHEIDATICDVLKFTLTFTGSYGVKRLETTCNSEDLKALRTTCEHQQLDNLIVGSTSSNKNREVNILVKVYDRKEDRITVSENIRMANLMDLLEVTHSLTAKVIEGFSGVHVEYGDISIQYFGNAQDIDLYVDSNLIGREVKRIDNMVAGTHTFTLQLHNSSSHTELLTKTVEIYAGVNNRIQFNIPIIDPRSAIKLTRLDASIAANWYENREKNILFHQLYTKSKVEQAYKIIHKSKYPESKRLLEKYEWWEHLSDSRKKIIPPEFIVSSDLKQQIGKQLSGYTTTNLDSENNTSFQNTLKDVKSNLLPYAHIKIDGKVDDWEGINPSIEDPKQFSLSKIKGTDLTHIYLAMNEEYLYVRYDLTNGPTKSENKYWYKMHCINPETQKRIILIIERKKSQFSSIITKNNNNTSLMPYNNSYDNKVAVKRSHIEARFSNREIKTLLNPNDYSNLCYLKVFAVQTGTNYTILCEDEKVTLPKFIIY